MKYDNLVLGHKGFLGSSFTRFLKKNNIPFTFIDEENFNYKKDFKKFFNLISKKIEKCKPQYIWNFIGSHTDNLNQNLDSNFLFSSYLINFINHKKLNCKIIFIGSAIEEKFICFSKIEKKKSSYAISKNLQSILIDTANVKKNLITFRLHNVYGDGIKPNLYPGYLNYMIDMVLKKKIKKIKIKFYNDKRYYLDVNRAVKKIYLSVKRKNLDNNFYEIKSSKKTSNFQLFKIIASRKGIKSFQRKILNKDLIIYNFNIKEINDIKNR